MRKGLLLLSVVCLFSCEVGDDKQTIVLANYQLNDGSTLLLEKKTGSYLGATTPNVTWINKEEKNGKKQHVGKIKQYLDGGIITFEPINDSLINVHYMDSIWHQASIFTVNVTKRIYPNDGSPYLQAKSLNR